MDRHSVRDNVILHPGMANYELCGYSIKHLRTDKLPSIALGAFGTSLSRTLRAAEPCKSAVLPICPASMPEIQPLCQKRFYFGFGGIHFPRVVLAVVGVFAMPIIPVSFVAYQKKDQNLWLLLNLNFEFKANFIKMPI